MYDADKLKVNQTLTLNSAVIPAPKTQSDEYRIDDTGTKLWSTACTDCDEVQLGDFYGIVWENLYDGDLSFRIENVWIG